ncbi:hypothetical protein LTR05_006929 [Lithohypha guttulata]|uniref:Uncharacterized protein n=1 Tax=Lithohypha guttulata TaxID=1690604 RepID=A0AAN7Y4U7_9EURO|nr:hypothetical protein LTR05_006929 [Lithohypha guttulata]
MDINRQQGVCKSRGREQLRLAIPAPAMLPSHEYVREKTSREPLLVPPFSREGAVQDEIACQSSTSLAQTIIDRPRSRLTSRPVSMSSIKSRSDMSMRTQSTTLDALVNVISESHRRTNYDNQRCGAPTRAKSLECSDKPSTPRPSAKAITTLKSLCAHSTSKKRRKMVQGATVAPTIAHLEKSKMAQAGRLLPREETFGGVLRPLPALHDAAQDQAFTDECMEMLSFRKNSSPDLKDETQSLDSPRLQGNSLGPLLWSPHRSRRTSEAISVSSSILDFGWPEQNSNHQTESGLGPGRPRPDSSLAGSLDLKNPSTMLPADLFGPRLSRTVSKVSEASCATRRLYGRGPPSQPPCVSLPPTPGKRVRTSNSESPVSPASPVFFNHVGRRQSIADSCSYLSSDIIQENMMAETARIRHVAINNGLSVVPDTVTRLSVNRKDHDGRSNNAAPALLKPGHSRGSRNRRVDLVRRKHIFMLTNDNYDDRPNDSYVINNTEPHRYGPSSDAMQPSITPHQNTTKVFNPLAQKPLPSPPYDTGYVWHLDSASDTTDFIGNAADGQEVQIPSTSFEVTNRPATPSSLSSSDVMTGAEKRPNSARDTGASCSRYPWENRQASKLVLGGYSDCNNDVRQYSVASPIASVNIADECDDANIESPSSLGTSCSEDASYDMDSPLYPEPENMISSRFDSPPSSPATKTISDRFLQECNVQKQDLNADTLAPSEIYQSLGLSSASKTNLVLAEIEADLSISLRTDETDSDGGSIIADISPLFSRVKVMDAMFPIKAGSTLTDPTRQSITPMRSYPTLAMTERHDDQTRKPLVSIYNTANARRSFLARDRDHGCTGSRLPELRLLPTPSPSDDGRFMDLNPFEESIKQMDAVIA